MQESRKSVCFKRFALAQREQLLVTERQNLVLNLSNNGKEVDFGFLQYTANLLESHFNSVHFFKYLQRIYAKNLSVVISFSDPNNTIKRTLAVEWSTYLRACHRW